MQKKVTIKEKVWIKAMQDQYYKKFGRKLYIDWEAMVHGTGIQSLPKKVNVTEADLRDRLRECCERYDITLEEFLTRLSLKERDDYKAVLTDFSILVFKNNWNKVLAAKVVNRDRKTLYSYYKQDK